MGRRRRMPWRRQAHWRRSGQCAQSGRAAVHTVAPRSNMAWLNSQDSPAGTSRSPSAVACRNDNGVPETARARTRTALVSTAATSSPKAKVRTARAVYGPTPGKARSAAIVVWHDSLVGRHDGHGRPVQVQRAPVVPQPRPQADHRCRSGRRAGRRCGEGRQEALVVRHHAVHLGLLQHDLGDEDRPGVPRAPPGQVALVLNPPFQQAAPEAPDPIGRERRGLSPRRRRRRVAGAPARPRSSTPSACAGSSRPPRRAG